MVVNWPPKETCGYPMSSGFVVTPCSPVCAANGIPGVGTGLPAGDREKPEARFVQHIRVEGVGPTRHPVDRVGAQVAAETGQQALLQDAGAERIGLPRIEKRSAKVGGVLL